ncbi:MAG: N-acetylmuramoyl-L-alanine amidase [Alphaproteobacteria bacterium]|nr:N-acetylmuramoyl-L-alanine amidase [Alphaproteobacteria bacterium]
MTDNGLLTRRRFLQAGLTASLLGAGAFALASKGWAAAAEAKPLPSRKPNVPKLLVLDPGHGGRDPGARGASGTLEKDITIDIAQRMADQLRNDKGIIVKLTREDDVFIPLEERVKFGREARADLFLSIHADSAPNKSARGLSVYTLSTKASDSFSKSLADKENEADLMGGMDLPPAPKEVTAILMDLTARQTRNTAQHARATFIRGLSRQWRLLEQPMRSANFVVLRAPDVPSMLIETSFLSNPQDEAILRQPSQRAKIAKLMARTIAAILDSSLFA